MENFENTKITVEWKCWLIYLELPRDANMEDWIHKFRLILSHQTFVDNTINRFIPDPYEEFFEEESEEDEDQLDLKDKVDLLQRSVTELDTYSKRLFTMIDEVDIRTFEQNEKNQRRFENIEDNLDDLSITKRKTRNYKTDRTEIGD